jgi:hypothetical protein
MRPNTLSTSQCSGSGSVGSVPFWPSRSRIRIRYFFLRIRLRIRIRILTFVIEKVELSENNTFKIKFFRQFFLKKLTFKPQI